jgi:uncharacterized membrane protein YeaQ/YmgE (transglycosylase-associated protein family)
MQPLVQLLIGAIAGVLAKLVLPAKVPGDFTGSILAGVMGSFIAGVIAWTAHGPVMIASSIGAVLMAAAFRFAVRGGQKREQKSRAPESRVPAT